MQSLILEVPRAEPADRRISSPIPPRVDASQLEQPTFLASLIAQRCTLSPDQKVEIALSRMQRQNVNFSAVLEGGRVLGQVARHGIEEMLGRRFGFALYGQADTREFVTAPSLTVTLGEPIAEILAAMNQREGASFYDDVMLLDASGQFLGFIYARTLVQVQHELYLQKINRLAASTASLNRLNAELAETYKTLVDVSRTAGMAEVATGVLHNVGNVLNSLNISASVLASGLRLSKCESLVRLAALLREHTTDFAEFLTNDPKGRRVPEFIDSLARHSVAERDRLLGETASLQQNVDHIKEIVSMQQAYATMVAVIEPLDPAALMEDSLRLNAGALARHEVQVAREFETGSLVLAEKAKVLQILINLIRNAKHACDESGRTDKVITLRIAAGGEGRVHLIVADNGVGIPAENLIRIFAHGFTTRANGHGFGLHSSVNAAREMKGSLSVHSDGPGRGASFTLELPAATPPPGVPVVP